jgi:hypothetical protein
VKQHRLVAEDQKLVEGEAAGGAMSIVWAESR